LRHHGRYHKYHRERLIDIVRGVCPVCETTHALIPSFSLPGSSHDTDDVERYLAGRAAGLTRREAGGHFLAEGREVRVLKRIERSFERCARNWSAIFDMDIPVKHAYATLAAAVEADGAHDDGPGVLLAANQHALERGVNAVFASRSCILLFRTGNAGKGIPHDPASARNAPAAPDSS
jgi:hypothetical protein